MAVRHRKRRKPAAVIGLVGTGQPGCPDEPRQALAGAIPLAQVSGEGDLREEAAHSREEAAHSREEVARLHAELHAHLRAQIRARMRAQGNGERLHVLEARIQALEGKAAYQDEVARLRLGTLERSQEDQEARLRALAESVARLTTTASLAQIAQAAFAVILSAIAAYLGRR